MKVDENSQLFLFLSLVVALITLVLCLWLFRDIRTLRNEVKHEVPAPYVVPREAERPQPNKWGFTVPPPPF
jgi:hypothetical protein